MARVHRLIVTTLQGEPLADVKVSAPDLVPVLAEWAALEGVCMYIDKVLVGPEQRAHLLRWRAEALRAAPGPCAAPASPAAPAQALTVQDVTTLSAALSQASAELIRGYQSFNEYMREVMEMQLAMQRDTADEAVRQRKLTAQSLADVDLMHRAVKTAELNQVFAAKVAHGKGPAPQALARSADTPGMGDLFHAAMRLFMGEDE